MKLLGTNTSPYVRKARLVLLEKNIPHTYIIDAPGEAGSHVPLLNPLGRIPVLVVDSETAVYDSTVIVEYVDTLNDTPILIPRDSALERMCVRRWEALADGIMDSAVMVRMESLRAPDKQDASQIATHNTAITRALASAAAQLGDREWCEGSAISLADLALTSALIYLDLRQSERGWRKEHPNLARWFEVMSQRHSVRVAMSS
jgi:glutathione S-transferase